MLYFKSLRKIRIGLRLGIGFAIILLIMVAGFLAAIIRMGNLSENIVNIYEHPFTVSNSVNDIYIDVLDVSRSVNKICLAENLKELVVEENRIDSLEKSIEESLVIVRSQYLGEKSHIDKISVVLAEWEPIRNSIVNLSKAGKNAEAIKALKNTGNPQVLKIVESISEARNFASKKANLFMLDSISQNKTGVRIMYLVSLIILLVSLLIAYAISKTLLIPISELKEISGKIAMGDLETKIEEKFKDEIGELSDSFRKMQQGLLERSEQAEEIAKGNLTVSISLLSEKDQMGLAFNRMADKLRLQLNEISEGIGVLASSSSEITASITQLAATSVETVTSVSETATTVDEVKQTAELVHFKAKEVSESAVKSMAFSKEGINAVGNSIEGMSRIQDQMDLIARTVVQLSEQSQTIGEITSAVVELAEQSNLLSVNAAIEAAKAGEHGKGFTVVAQEIKNLSNRSKEAANQVKTILRDVQKSINSAVSATEEGNKAVDEGLKLTNISGKTISMLSESLGEAVNAAVQIAASSRQQLEGMDQIAIAMNNIRESTIQASASTKQSVDSVKEIQIIGARLNDLIIHYRVK